MQHFKNIDKKIAVLDEVHFMYKGFYYNVEVRLQGRVGIYESRFTKVFVRLFVNGQQISWVGREGYGTERTARKHAQEYIASLAQWTKNARVKDWPERADYDAHMTDFRNYGGAERLAA